MQPSQHRKTPTKTTTVTVQTDTAIYTTFYVMVLQHISVQITIITNDHNNITKAAFFNT